MNPSMATTIGRATGSLLLLTTQPDGLDLTSTPISMEFDGLGNMRVTLHAVKRGTGDDVEVQAIVNENGIVTKHRLRVWAPGGMRDWQVLDMAEPIAAQVDAAQGA